MPQFGVRVTTHDVTATQAIVSVTGLAQNASAGSVDTRARITLLNAKGRSIAQQTTIVQAVPAGATADFRLDFTVAKPDLWSPSSPNRYTAKVELLDASRVLDAETVLFGVRNISMTGQKGLLVNGQPMKLRGANLHTDLGGLGGAAIPEAELRRLRIVKAAGFNAIRTSHNPQSATFLDACDQLGLLVIAELYDVWSEHKRADDYAPLFDSTWQHDVKRVIDRDANRPSIIMWSTENELGIRSRSPLQDVYGKPLADYLQQLDPTRPVTQGSAMGHALGLRLPDDSPEWSYLGVASLHYLKQTDDGFEHIHDAHPDEPLYIGETWGSQLYDFTKTVNDNGWVIGEFAWTGMDYLGEAGIGLPQSLPTGTQSGGSFGAKYPVFNSYCGDIDLIGQPKPQLAWRKVVWGDSQLEVGVERPTPAGYEQSIALWSYYDELPSWTWNVPAKQAMRVRAYTPGDRVVLKLNNVVVGEVALTEADKMVATFSVPYAPGTLVATAYKGRQAIASQRLTTVGAPARLKFDVEEGRLGQDVGSLAHILVSVVDATGHDVPDAVVKVNFALTGPATLAAVSSANPHNVDSFRQPHRYTYHGKALAIVRSIAGNGVVQLTASADGLRSVAVNL
ncbi:glycoside hydrolase family 2 TIM barrel-domain containing protein [Subtercola boreus]|uniref:glycoside hydrolase family 2 TIM barrel-domain containing protein n=1 Tax=Subtercola boreus TaxID=120213 RepID=UPI0011C0378E|nr:glycoside hydrolase family 2 TIM barrel-domain containing protein [Subtercola boreus]